MPPAASRLPIASLALDRMMLGVVPSPEPMQRAFWVVLLMAGGPAATSPCASAEPSLQTQPLASSSTAVLARASCGEASRLGRASVAMASSQTKKKMASPPPQERLAAAMPSAASPPATLYAVILSPEPLLECEEGREDGPAA